MGKPIKINNWSMYEVEMRGEKHICTIENVGLNEYYAYNDHGEGVSIVYLESSDIVELMTTGSIDREGYTIKPL